jgi:hypothetical protein
MKRRENHQQAANRAERLPHPDCAHEGFRNGGVPACKRARHERQDKAEQDDARQAEFV